MKTSTPIRTVRDAKREALAHEAAAEARKPAKRSNTTRTEEYDLTDLRKRAAKAFAKTVGVVGNAGGWICYEGTGRNICQGWDSYYTQKAQGAILDAITADYTAFHSFRELTDAINYKPTLRIESWQLALLAMEYNRVQVARRGTASSEQSYAYTPDWVVTSYSARTQEFVQRQKAEREANLKAQQERAAAELEARKHTYEVTITGTERGVVRAEDRVLTKKLEVRAVNVVEAAQAASYQSRGGYYFTFDRILSIREVK